MNNKDTIVYKFYNNQNELLYIGITNNIDSRLYQHKQDKEWWNEISRIEISDLMTRNEAHIYEIYYIAILFPKYNVDFVGGGTVGFKLNDIIFNEYEYDLTDDVKIPFEQTYNKLIIHLDSLMKNNIKMFNFQQEELRSILLEGGFEHIITKLNNGHKNRGLTITKIKELFTIIKLPYIIDSKKESSRRSENYNKYYWYITM